MNGIELDRIKRALAADKLARARQAEVYLKTRHNLGEKVAAADALLMIADIHKNMLRALDEVAAAVLDTRVAGKAELLGTVALAGFMVADRLLDNTHAAAVEKAVAGIPEDLEAAIREVKGYLDDFGRVCALAHAIRFGTLREEEVRP